MDVEMINRVAKVLCISRTGDDYYWQHYIEVAREAIKAMREPTEKMIMSNDIIDPSEYQWIKEVWHKIIDAILND